LRPRLPQNRLLPFRRRSAFPMMSCPARSNPETETC